MSRWLHISPFASTNKVSNLVMLCIKFRNHKVVGVENCSRAEIASAQSREKPMCLELIDSLRQGLNQNNHMKYNYETTKHKLTEQTSEYSSYN